MSIKYGILIILGIIGLLISVAIGILSKRRVEIHGAKIGDMYGLEDDNEYKSELAKYKLIKSAINMMYIVLILLASLVAAQPYTKEVRNIDEYNRDILLTLDISKSVDELNLELLGELEKTVESLQGERFGIIIFNTSAVMICPLTNDYDYVISKIEEIRNELQVDTSNSGDTLFSFHYLTEGTLVNNEQLGSSLIGDGLASALYNFPDLRGDRDRKRIVIFSTDNDLQGTPVYTLYEASELCKKNNVKVYGIGTKNMGSNARIEMETAITNAGGKFYLEEESGTVKNIVDDINKEEKSVIHGETYTIEEPRIKLLIVSLVIISMLIIVIRRYIRE